MDSTQLYFAVMHDFQWAMEARKYRQALEFLKQGLRLTPDALDSMQREYRWIPPSVPFAESRGGAIVALFDDEEAYELLESVSHYFVGKRAIDIERYRADAKLMARVRELLSIDKVMSVEALKREVEPGDRSRLTRMLGWMEKNSELSLEKGTNSTTVSLGVATFVPSVVLPTFRAGLTSAAPRVIPLRYIDWMKSAMTTELREHEEQKVQSDKTWGRVSSSPLAPDERQSGVMRVARFRDGFWLIGYSKSKINNESQTLIVVKANDGATIKTLALPIKVARWFTTAVRSQIVLLDSTLGVRVLGFMGEEMHSFSLANCPEVQSVFRMVSENVKLSAVVRTVDVCPRTGEILFSVIDHLWRFTREGELISASVFPVGEPTNAHSTELVRNQGKDLVLPQQLENNWNRNWVDFAAFSDLGDEIHVSFGSGHLLKLSRAAQVNESWVLSGGISRMQELGDGRLLVYGRDIQVLKPSGIVKTFKGLSGIEYLDDQYVVGRVGNEVWMLDWRREVAKHFDLPKEFRAIYPVDDGARVDMTTEFAVLNVD